MCTILIVVVSILENGEYGGGPFDEITYRLKLVCLIDTTVTIVCKLSSFLLKFVINNIFIFV